MNERANPDAFLARNAVEIDPAAWPGPDDGPNGPGAPSPAAGGWGEPDPALLGSGRRPAPAFPLEVLGPFWSGWCRERAGAVSAPEDYVAMALLAAAGGVLANVRWPMAGAAWAAPPHLWAGLVGDPSSGKSPALKAVFDLVGAAEAVRAHGFDDVRRRWEADKRAASARREAWEREVEDAVSAGAPPPPMPADAEEPDKPERPRIGVQDTTGEKLVAVAAGVPHGLVMMHDELAAWLGSFDRYGGEGADRALFLKAFDGALHMVDRVKHGRPLRVPRLSVGVLGGIQPDKLPLITDGPDDGLAARFLYCWPDARPDFVIPREALDDTPARRAFERLAALAMGRDEEGAPVPIRVRLTPDAVDALQAYGQATARRGAEAHGLHAGWLGKARGFALRLSCILTYLRWASGVLGMEPDAIEAEAIEAAVAFLDAYAEPMLERVAGDAAIPEPERLARALVRALRRRGEPAFNARSLRREVGGLFRHAKKMEAACEELLEANLIRLTPRRAGTTPGRTSKDYEVNPVVLAGRQPHPCR